MGTGASSRCADFAARRGHNNSDNAAILAAAALFPPDRAAGLIEAIIAGHAKEALGPRCSLLKAAIAGPFAAKSTFLATTAEGLIAPGDASSAPVDQWGRRHDVGLWMQLTLNPGSPRIKSPPRSVRLSASGWTIRRCARPDHY
jgi:hypothetical protein